MHHSQEARFAAVASLQAIRRRHTPGSPRYEQIEHAIDLALSTERTVDQYLVRNVLRDAKRILSRQAKARIFVRVTDEPDWSDDANHANGYSETLIENVTPEHLAEVTDCTKQIVATVSRTSNHAARVMDGMLTGEALNETAAEIGITADRVNQIRRQIRTIVAEQMGLGHAH